MSIPILSDIIDGIKWIIDFAFNKAPRPVQIGLFLLILLLFASIIPFMFHIFGIHCNSESNAVKTPTLGFITNLKLAFIDKDEGYNFTEYQPDTISLLPYDLGGESCVKPICHYSEDIWYWQSSSNCDNKTIVYPFLTKNWNWQKCVVCNGSENYTIIRGDTTLAGEREYLCFGDAYRIPDRDMSWVQRAFCDPESRCIPPRNYYYEYDTGKYTCLNPEICGSNVTIGNQTYLIDEELKEADAERLYKDDVKTYDKAFYFKCDKELNPQLTFFGIPFLDYKIWLIIMVIAVMFIFLTNIKRH